MTFFEATNSVFNIADENKSFFISIPGRWRVLLFLEDGTIDELKKILKRRSQNYIELYVQEVRKHRDKMKIYSKVFFLLDFDNLKKKYLKNSKC